MRTLSTFYVMTCDVDWDDADIRAEWLNGRRQTQAYSILAAAREEGSEAVGDDDGEQIAVIIATKEDGSDAKRYVITYQSHYDVGGPRDVDMYEPPVDVDGNVIKGLADDKTIALF